MAASALRALHEWRRNVVLLDLVLPGQDGFTVLARKAKDDAVKDIPVIVISARDPQREPVMSNALVVTRQGGLSARDRSAAPRVYSDRSTAAVCRSSAARKSGPVTGFWTKSAAPRERANWR